MVGYDLNKPRANDDYKKLISALENDFSNWWHHLDSTWIIKTNLGTAAIRDKLGALIDSGDELLVARLQGDWASRGFNTQGTQWLQDNVTYE